MNANGSARLRMASSVRMASTSIEMYNWKQIDVARKLEFRTGRKKEREFAHRWLAFGGYRRLDLLGFGSTWDDDQSMIEDEGDWLSNRLANDSARVKLYTWNGSLVSSDLLQAAIDGILLRAFGPDRDDDINHLASSIRPLIRFSPKLDAKIECPFNCCAILKLVSFSGQISGSTRIASRIRTNRTIYTRPSSSLRLPIATQEPILRLAGCKMEMQIRDTLENPQH